MRNWIVYWTRRRSLRAESNISNDLILTPERIRERLVNTSLDKSLADVMMPPGADLWPDELKKKLNSTMTPAAVLIPIVERSAELTLLLTRRSAELKHHAGQISFPGGRCEEHEGAFVAWEVEESGPGDPVHPAEPRETPVLRRVAPPRFVG